MKLFEELKINVKKNRQIYNDNKEEIAKINTTNITQTYIFALVVLFLCCCCSFLPVLKTNLCFFSISFFVFAIMLCLHCILSRRNHLVHGRLYFFVSLIFATVLVFECAMPSSSGMLFQVLLISVPLIFYVKFDACFMLITFITICYCVLCAIFKDGNLVPMELFKTIICYLISMFTFNYINFLKFNNLDIKRKLIEQAGLDELTKLPNRRTFNLFMKQNEHFFEDESVDVSIVMMDIDWFKFYNDTYGHLQGDVCLQKIANTLAKIAKEYDIFIARFGGEEFVAYIVNKSVEEVDNICKSIVESIANLKIEHSKSPFGHVTISAGYATKKLNHKRNNIELINCADEALYYAKSSEEKSYKAAKMDW